MISSKNIVKYSKWVGYSLLGIYSAVAVVFTTFLVLMNMLPFIHLAIIVVFLAIVGILLSIFHGDKVPSSVISSIITIGFTVILVIGIRFINRTTEVIDEVTTIEVQTDVVSVFVLIDDPAECLEDARDYLFGIVRNIDRENTDKTIIELNELLDSDINTYELDGFVETADALRRGEVGAIIVNDALIRIVGDMEGYEWVRTDLRVLKMVEHEIIITEPLLEPPEELPDSFIMLITGIDTYGSVSARARSDANILMVVNTVDKEILLLSTPRDSFVTFDLSGYMGDKLAHAGIYGVDQSVSAIERLYDINIDYFFRLNFTGFMNIIDALGGVNVYSHYEFTVHPIRTYHVGWNHLSGIEALAFTRERAGFAAGDHQRAVHQMEVIRAVMGQATSPALLLNYNAVMTAVGDSFESNMPRRQIADLVRMQLSDMAGWSITTFTTSGFSSMGQTFSMPGHMLYIINLHEESIEEAQRLINETMRIQ